MLKQNTNIYKPFFPLDSMKRLRQIKKYGNSFVIALFQTDIKDFELKEGDEVDISLIKKEANQNEKSN